MVLFFLLCLLLGCVAGFFAGLFGIGGGMLIVPALIYLLPTIGVPQSALMAAALGTSFATIVITGFSSAQRHQKLGHVVWPIVKRLAPVIVITTFICGLFIAQLDKSISSKLFSCLVIYLAVKMLLSINAPKTMRKLTALSTVIGGIFIGAASSAAGIGGGGFIVPFLNARGVEIRQAIGTSSVCGVFLGLSGCFSFIVSGMNSKMMPDFSLGFIYLPAVLAITLTSFFTSKWGASLTQRLPVSTLKRGFALLLIVIAFDMFMK